MANKILIQNALELVQQDQDNAIKTLLSLVEEKGFLLKKEKIEKETLEPQYSENPEFLIKTESSYFYNQNKEAICLYMNYTNDGTYAVHMYDYKNAKQFSAYIHPEGTNPESYCFKKLESIRRERIEEKDLKYSYGFDFTR